MKERVLPLELGVVWDPNAPDAILITPDIGPAVLALNSRLDDPDRSCVVLRWRGVALASASGPNDEAISGHRLFRKGLDQVRWIGTVEGSDLIRRLERQNSVHLHHDPSRFSALTHYIVMTKENTIEVTADALEVLRIPGCTLDAAVAALDA